MESIHSNVCVQGSCDRTKSRKLFGDLELATIYANAVVLYNTFSRVSTFVANGLITRGGTMSSGMLNSSQKTASEVPHGHNTSSLMHSLPISGEY
jgi:hypothetical protein